MKTQGGEVDKNSRAGVYADVATSWAMIFFAVALIAGVAGFAGLAGPAGTVAEVLFFVFLALFGVTLVAGWRPR